MSDLITLPPGYCAIKYPGYFWHAPTQQLCTIKMGTLRALKFSDWYTTRHGLDPGYRISHLGKRHNVKLKFLRTLVPKASVVPEDPIITKLTKQLELDLK